MWVRACVRVCVRALSHILRERESKHKKGGKMELIYFSRDGWKTEGCAPELRTMSRQIMNTDGK